MNNNILYPYFTSEFKNCIEIYKNNFKSMVVLNFALACFFILGSFFSASYNNVNIVVTMLPYILLKIFMALYLCLITFDKSKKSLIHIFNSISLNKIFQIILICILSILLVLTINFADFVINGENRKFLIESLKLKWIFYLLTYFILIKHYNAIYSIKKTINFCYINWLFLLKSAIIFIIIPWFLHYVLSMGILYSYDFDVNSIKKDMEIIIKPIFENFGKFIHYEFNIEAIVLVKVLMAVLICVSSLFKNIAMSYFIIVWFYMIDKINLQKSNM